jgi:hypothetical protein
MIKGHRAEIDWLSKLFGTSSGSRWSENQLMERSGLSFQTGSEIPVRRAGQFDSGALRSRRFTTGMSSTRGTWFFLVVGAVIGLALGILVSVTTDIPLAPEIGLVLGALVGWLSRRVAT